MEESSPDELPPEPESQAPDEGSEAAPQLALFPPYAVALLLVSALSLYVTSTAASTWHGAEGNFPEETRRQVVFGLVFAWAVGAALVAAWLGELVASVVRLVRRRPAGRVLARLALTLLPLAVFGVGQRIVNPWLLELVHQLRGMGQGG